MRFGVLGPMVVRRGDGTEVPVGGPRLRALLAVLLVDAGRVVGVDRLVDSLYGDRPPAGAVNAVQSLVSRLRSVLDVVVERSPAGYRLVVDPSEVDALRFEELLARGLPGEALALWRGPALRDVGDAPFASVVAARWEELRLRAVEDHDVAPVGVLRELVGEFPLRERLVARLVRVLHREGRGAEALAVFERTRRLLAEELGADPGGELAAAHLAVVRGERVAARHVLPAQLTSFVGRAEEVRSVVRALAGSRLVTLLGPGGAGKTRLAVEVAAADPGDVFFVDLASVVAGGDVPRAVVSALGLRERVVSAPVDRLVAALAERSVLVVLDNCEHVVADVAVLAGVLLAACPGLRVVATSREALGVTGEVVRPVPPLPVDDVGSPAVRLFVDRAVAVNPSFVLDGVSGPLVVEICRALDGLPLAIELAAARVRSLPLAEVAARLGDRFRLLSRGSRAVVARHRTLHAVVEWSWGLLGARERELARRLTVFADGVSLAAAEAVCGVAGVDEVLPSLVEKSLVEVSGGRFRMLETIREFCGARLVEAGEEEVLRRAHAEWVLGLLVEAAPRLLRAEQVVWLERLAAEHGNVRAAVRWAVSADVALALRLVAEAGWYFWLRGLRSEGAAVAGEVVRAAGPVAPAGLAEEYLLCALMASSMGEGWPDLPGAPSPKAKSPEGFAGPPTRPFLTMLWGMAFGVPDVDVPVLDGRRAQLIGPDPWSRALALLGLGLQFQYAGQLGRAREAHGEALAGFRALGERWGMSTVLAQLAELSRLAGGLDEALAFLDEALALAEVLGASEHTAGMLVQRAEWAAWRGGFDAAWADLERAAGLARSQGALEMLASAWLGMAEVCRSRGEPVRAAGWLAEALRVCPAGWFGPEETRAGIRVAAARLALARGDVAGAREALGLALASAVEWGNAMVLARVAEGRAAVALAEGDARGAALLAGAARGMRGAVAVVDPDVVAVEGGARAVLGPVVFGEVVARGAGLGRDGVVAVLGA
ncbi:BTAD domain-containing putative transcriptional regulator [Saccharothrix obliqua]|uniref:BTAD domain-containing putative transcriptional regulator n=1 Tax=Saccharothrix obliqua TaxID=2861747 RepID=UPI001C5F941F|nr:BTAD domain-containing putative transcriptional regulator [Saccharothrix obliqua]MBW4722096.1 winged helix-turn-helix domain-containing protein [Saccharothrix obliqua]